MSYRSNIKAVRLMSIVVLCISLLSFFAVIGFAEDYGTLTLTLLDREEGTPVSEVAFRLYKFASAENKNGKYVYTYDEGYRACGMDMGNFGDSYLPIHLAAYAQYNGMTYTEAVTDDMGMTVFEELSLGAYLVLPVGEKEGYITPTPFIITVPMWDAAEEKWQFDIDASPKTDIRGEEGAMTHISVKKQWFGEGEHPSEIKVSLLRDSVIVDTVILNGEKDWYHRWDRLDRAHSWSVAEISVPEGYAVGYNISEMTVTIDNSKLEYDDPTDDSPGETTDDTEPGDTTPPDKLIQTGQLNWPVPVLSVMGLVIFAAGWALCNLGRGEEDNR